MRFKVKYDKGVRIGQLSDLTGLPTPTIRYYEQVGLMPQPTRAANGYRDYDNAALERLSFIKAAQTMGFSLGEVKEIVACWDRGDAICEPVVALIEARLRDLSHQIANLSKARNELARLLREARTAPPQPKGICHAIERVGGHRPHAPKSSSRTARTRSSG